MLNHVYLTNLITSYGNKKLFFSNFVLWHHSKYFFWFKNKGKKVCMLAYIHEARSVPQMLQKKCERVSQHQEIKYFFSSLTGC